MVPGLHAALASMLAHWKRSAALDLYVFSDQLGSRDESLVAETVQRFAGAAVRLRVVRYIPAAPPGGRRLYGSATLFGRLDLPDLLPEVDRCLYLDCDLIVSMDLARVLAAIANDAPLHADGAGLRKSAYERDLYYKAGLDLQGPCFNSGVLGINLRRWRAENLRARCLEICERFSGDSRLTDQAMLNIAFADSFHAMGESINTPMYPSTLQRNGEHTDRIFHFVGSPKPWDLMGWMVHRSHALWRTWARKTAWWNVRSRLAPLLFVRRNVLVARSTLRAFRSRR